MIAINIVPEKKQPCLNQLTAILISFLHVTCDMNIHCYVVSHFLNFRYYFLCHLKHLALMLYKLCEHLQHIIIKKGNSSTHMC